MEPPLKRRRVSTHDSTQDVGIKRARSALRLKSRFESIFAKFGKDFSGVGDEIDLETGRIVVNNGHLLTMQHEHDVEGECNEEDELGGAPLVDDPKCTDPHWANGAVLNNRSPTITEVSVGVEKHSDPPWMDTSIGNVMRMDGQANNVMLPNELGVSAGFLKEVERLGSHLKKSQSNPQISRLPLDAVHYEVHRLTSDSKWFVPPLPQDEEAAKLEHRLYEESIELQSNRSLSPPGQSLWAAEESSTTRNSNQRSTRPIKDKPEATNNDERLMAAPTISQDNKGHQFIRKSNGDSNSLEPKITQNQQPELSAKSNSKKRNPIRKVPEVASRKVRLERNELFELALNARNQQHSVKGSERWHSRPRQDSVGADNVSRSTESDTLMSASGNAPPIQQSTVHHRRKESLPKGLSQTFICTLCSRRFCRRAHLERHYHSLQHCGEKPFECNVCGKKFSRQDNLVTHVRIHENSTVDLQEHVMELVVQQSAADPAECEDATQTESSIKPPRKKPKLKSESSTTTPLLNGKEYRKHPRPNRTTPLGEDQNSLSSTKSQSYPNLNRRKPHSSSSPTCALPLIPQKTPKATTSSLGKVPSQTTSKGSRPKAKANPLLLKKKSVPAGVSLTSFLGDSSDDELGLSPFSLSHSHSRGRFPPIPTDLESGVKQSLI